MCVGFPVMLQPGHHRNDHGAALGVFEQVAADSGLDRAAELTVIPAALAAAGDAVSGVHGNILQLLHQIAGFLHINESAGDDLRRGQQRAVLRGDGKDHHHHAVLCQTLAVPHDHGAHVADAGAVHIHLAGGDGVGGQLHGLAGDHAAQEKGARSMTASDILSGLCVQLQMLDRKIARKEDTGENNYEK